MKLVWWVLIGIVVSAGIVFLLVDRNSPNPILSIANTNPLHIPAVEIGTNQTEINNSNSNNSIINTSYIMTNRSTVVVYNVNNGGGGGGGGGSNPTPTPTPTTVVSIANFKICVNMTQDKTCDMSVQRNHNTLYAYWEVPNGVGCCNTYNCNYALFNASCLQPDFKLYHFYLDGVPYMNTSNWDWSKFVYTCSATTPWNWFYVRNVSAGTHTIMIEQIQSCDSGVVADIKSFQFTMTQNSNSSWSLTQ